MIYVLEQDDASNSQTATAKYLKFKIYISRYHTQNSISSPIHNIDKNCFANFEFMHKSKSIRESIHRKFSRQALALVLT